MDKLKKIQFWVGFSGIVVFLLTGQYMALVLNLGDFEDAPRMIYRASHIYLLLGSVINLVLGIYYTPPPNAKAGAWISPLLILLSPFLLLYGFFLEAATGNIDRPVTAIGLYFIFLGAAIMGIKAFLVKLNLLKDRVTASSD